MALLFALLCILAAILMALLAKIEVEIKYSKALSVILHISLLAIELRSKGSSETGEQKKDKTPSLKTKIKQTATYLKFTEKLIEGADVTLNSLSLPNLIPADFSTLYIKNAVYSSALSVFCAYLSSKASKLYESKETHIGADEGRLLDVTLKMSVLHILKSYIVMRRRFSEIRAEGK